MTGVCPRGAHVRRVTGSSEAPDSSQNTMAALRRRAAARILGPVLGHPAGNRPLVALDGAAGGALQAVAHAVAQQLPGVAGMVGDPGQLLDHRRDSGKGPVVGVEAVREGAFAQRLVNGGKLLVGQARGGAGRAGAAERVLPALAPTGVPAADDLPGHTQLVGDLGLGVAGGKQLPGLHADAFERLAVAQTTGVAAVGGWSHPAMLPGQPRSRHRNERTSLAPLCRLLRQDVLDAIARPDSALSILAEEWRSYLFADADDSQFADAYAQTLTYAMLLARLEGASSLHSDAARVLDRHHGLLAQVLRVLGQPQARKEIEIPVTLLEQSIEAVDHRRLAGRHGEPWLYFYETFLASYDSKLRRERGVYYTPAEVVEVQTSLVAELLQDRFGKRFTFVDDDVTVLDPAVGTGTYLLTALQIGLNQVRLRYGLGAEAHRATTAAHNFHGFEILVGPYAVAQLRLAQQIMDLGGSIPEDGLGIYLTDTLESPWKTPGGQLNLLHQRLVEENRRAREVKATTRVLVCIGNPPYHRGTDAQINRPAIRAGNWVRDGDDGRGGILEDFIQPLRAAGLGVHAKNLYNEYVYFWRWALWKVLDSTGGPGIVSFITASSYLRGPGFAGMRQVMRQTFDRIWILDLEGDITGSRKTDNIFATTTPVAIAIGVRYGEPQETTPAFVRYARIRGTRPEKLRELKSIRQLDDVQWQDCKSDWLAPFSPKAVGRYFDWPLLADLFPWQHSGVQFKRTWPIAPSREQLERRWKRLLTYPPGERAVAFRETPDREVRRAYSSLGGSTPCHRCRISMRPRRHHRYSATPIEASTGNGYCSTTVSATVSGPSSGRSILMSRFTSLVSLRELSDQARRQPRRLTFLTCITSEVPMAAPTSSPSGVIERLLVRT